MTQTARLADVLCPRQGQVVDEDAVYRIAGVYSFGRGLLRRPTILGRETSYKALTRLQLNDVVYSKLGAFEGAVDVVDSTFDGSYVSPEFPVFAISKDVDAEFLRHYVTSGLFEEQLQSVSSGIGARQRRVHPDAFLSLTFPRPSLSEQRRIAVHLDRLALVAAKHEHAKRHREASTQGIKNGLIRSAGGQTHALRDVLTMRPGGGVVNEVRYRMTGVYSFGRGLLDRGALSGSDTKYKMLTPLSAGNVVYSKLGAFENAVAVADDRFNGSFVSPEFPVFEVDEAVDPDFLRAALTTTRFAEALGAATSGVGARQKRVSPTAFLGLEIQLPSEKDQKCVADMLRTVERSNHLMRDVAKLTGALVPAARNEIFSAMR